MQPAWTPRRAAHELAAAAARGGDPDGRTAGAVLRLALAEEAACYGPASSGSHGTDEWVSLSSIAEVATVLALLLRRWGAESA